MVKRTVKYLFAFSALLAGCADARGTVLRLRDAGGHVAPTQDAGARDANTPEEDAQIAHDAGSDAGPHPHNEVGRCRRGTAGGFLDQFDGDKLNPQLWLVANGNVPIATESSRGGLVKENVSVSGGKLVLSVRGDDYTGPVRGIDSTGKPLVDGKRSGAAIATRDLYMSGSYHWEGTLSAPAGVKLVLIAQRQDPADGYISLTAPGKNGANASYNFAEAHVEGPLSAPQTLQVAMPNPLDNNVPHSLRFDWHSGGGGNPQHIDIWEDGNNLQPLNASGPVRAARAWLVAFVPDGTAAPFDTVEIRIETAFITLFSESADQCKDGEQDVGILIAP